MEEKIDSN